MNRSQFAMYDDAPPQGVPSCTIDPFGEAFSADPYGCHEQMREQGPLLWLSRYNLLATARYEQVRQALTDWQTYSSARGVGMADLVRHGRFRLPSIILEVDPPDHTRARNALNKALSPAVMASLREPFLAAARTLVEELVAHRAIDVVPDLAQAYPLRVFPDAIGMRSENRHYLLPYGDMVFNSFGPANELFQESAKRARETFKWVEDEALRVHLRPDGFGMILYRCADAGEITEDEAHKLVRSMLTAGVDTTVNGIGAMLYCMTQFPDQWLKLRANPGSQQIRGAFEEAVRFASPVQTFFRTTTRATELGGVKIEADRKVLLFLGAANRDPRRWENPDTYDIERKTIGHVGYGSGVHACVGQLLARLEGEVVMQALLERVQRIEPNGEARFHPNNTLRGLASLPVRLIPA